MRVRFMLMPTLFLAACGPASQEAAGTISMDSARAIIQRENARWVRYANANQPESLAGVYAFDGVAMPPNRPFVTGRDSLVALFRTLAAPGGVITLTNDHLMPAGPDDIFARGSYSYAVPAQGSTPASTITGRYVEHWRKRDGKWWMLENIWTTDAPPPPAPARR